MSGGGQPAVHKAEPAIGFFPPVCATCGEFVAKVPGGSGPVWVHEATGAVAGSGSPAGEEATAGYFADEMGGLFADEAGFRDPEKAAMHAVIIQGGYTTPVREAYRMIKDGGVHRDRAVAWLAASGYDPQAPEDEALAAEAGRGR